MINVGLYYKIKKGHEHEFESKFKDVVEYLSKGEGFRLAKLYKEVSDPSEYMIYSEWDGMDSFMGFVRSEAFHSVTSAAKDIVEGQPRHRVFYESEDKGH
ncbi:Antibiotic biosynthesis monooxygenase [Candidatus Micrarchaeum sp.]|jgi:heme-degrading monooxygenase HmoA|uniref:antibiotic biosynthesis monooxygenase family protein n=1 Tax=Candidatus Micrarchaeum sp. TaxID=2282148 RepID=UPI000927132C|nr:antibiotic biosynthesis monooxygenase [Candidatus Micrarchaeum sp.]OJI06716.1 MAG: antibiotic biosynthesis monooxygenase [Candidatus Micrarchaeum sp. ARMAN-1]OJT94225.1 MAG: antibiotic biosynthesis monooxygenase [Candidatus Micrarchaeum sp. AZ1]OWP53412.1 MAG: antibiotic biosynthesis monooxygenase [Thermoplasmatales archaeon ARMAN]QRF73826.1 Antibiotic biosynthesis monooxygenase [Candidatus Micrarchaeum sp.]